MGTNKKTIFISWFIGVGFGLFFSGIILSILVYTSNKGEPIPIDNQEQAQEVKDEGTDFPNTTETLEKEETPETPKAIEVAETPEIVEVPDRVETIQLEIKQSATAKEITKMLVDNHVISDYDAFIAYIVSMDAERSLSHGNKVFPLNSDIETVFKILRPYN